MYILWYFKYLHRHTISIVEILTSITDQKSFQNADQHVCQYKNRISDVKCVQSLKILSLIKLIVTLIKTPCRAILHANSFMWDIMKIENYSTHLIGLFQLKKSSSSDLYYRPHKKVKINSGFTNYIYLLKRNSLD